MNELQWNKNGIERLIYCYTKTNVEVSSQVLELERMRLENRVNLHLSLGGTVKTMKKWAQIIAILVIGLLE